MKNGSKTTNHNEVEFPTIRIAPNSIRTALTDLINEFIRIEKSIRGLEYQQHSFIVRGQIDLLTSIIDDRWNNKGKTIGISCIKANNGVLMMVISY
ncbi:hypothetical protein AAXB25_22780 [Paenibacillus lautus]|uniref:hypothetical protein n=1 Tax=Paenibacillus lautus TaxID=1401 RepID=UPI003D2872C2